VREPSHFKFQSSQGTHRGEHRRKRERGKRGEKYHGIFFCSSWGGRGKIQLNYSLGEGFCFRGYSQCGCGLSEALRNDGGGQGGKGSESNMIYRGHERRHLMKIDG